jgi:hypothetical protein
MEVSIQNVPHLGAEIQAAQEVKLRQQAECRGSAVNCLKTTQERSARPE